MSARIVIAGVSSGVGKTTVVTALARALRKRGLSVAMFKCGPDYLDPTYHARAAGVVSHNLDGFLMGRDAVRSTFAHAARGADVALIEGVMGLFDGASPTSQEGSTAEIAKWLQAPVLLVCDASGMARSVAALAHGFATFDRELHLAGVVCNRLGSPGHLELLRRALDLPPIVGGLPKQPDLAFPERHLGLVTAGAGVDERTFDAWAEHVATWFDLDAVLALARNAAPLADAPRDAFPSAHAARCRIGLAFDDAFHFYYADNLRRLEALGAELVRFSPVADEHLPDVDGLYIGGGYPELFAAELARNAGMRAQIAAFAAAGHPIYAECGGLMYLSRAIRTRDGARHEMAGVVPGETEMQERLQALGYAEVETQCASVLGPAGLRFRGHQFRYSALKIDAGVECAYTLRARRKGEVMREGYRIGNTLASYVHAHWASNPLVAQNFVAACAAQPGAV
jgi:cobyrinic acid a,c-diamide synthase